MSILREYRLPNCVLRLEGLSQGSDINAHGGRPEMNILTRVECNFEKEKQSLVGGKDLLESLIQATNFCVQGIISGLPSLYRSYSEGTGVQIQDAGEGRFELKVPESLLLERENISGAENSHNGSGVQFQLTSVQIFDLMEAIDQLISDQQTLPDLNVPLRSRSRKEVKSETSTVQKSAPFAVGTASMLVAAAGLFLMPIPKTPTPTQTETPSLSQPSPAGVSPSVSPGASPEPTPESTQPPEPSLESTQPPEPAPESMEPPEPAPETVPLEPEAPPSP
jgi:hypothetical protein